MRIAYSAILWTLIMTCSIARAQSDDAAQHFSRGEQFFEEKDFDSASFYFAAAAKGFDMASNAVESIRSVARAGECFIKMRKVDRGIALLTRHEQRADKIDATHEVRENFYNTLSELYYYAGDSFNSLKYHEIVCDINGKRGDTAPEKQINLTRIMGVLLGNSGQLKRAVDYYMQYAALIREHHGDKHMSMSDAYNYLGVMYRNLGEYDIALDYYKKSIEIGEQYTADERAAISPRFRSIAPVYNNIGTLHHHLNDNESALAYSLKALNLYENDKSAGKSSLASILNGLGATYARLARYPEALQCKERALQMYIAEYGEQHGRVAAGLNHIGDVYFEIKDYVQAENYYRRALDMDLRVSGPFHPNTSASYARMANIEEARGNYDEAIRHIQQAICTIVPEFKSDNIAENPEPGALCNVRSQLIERLTKKGDLMMANFSLKKDERMLRSAYETYSAAVGLSEAVRNEMLDIRSKGHLIENSKTLYEKTLRNALLLNSITGDPKYNDAAFSIMEKNKSRLLLESLQSSQIKSTNEREAQLFNTENGLQSEIAYLEQKIMDERTREGGPDSAKTRQWNERLFETRRQLESFKRALQAENPKYYLAKYNIPETASVGFQHALQKNEVLLEYFSGDSTLYLYYATREKSGFIELKKGVQSEVRQLISSIRDRDAAQFRRLAYPLYTKLLEPALQKAGAVADKIIIIPDGILSYLPFELLLTAPADENKFRGYSFAIRKHNFSYRLSATLMVNRFRDHGKDKNSLFAGFAPKFEGPILAQRGLPGDIPYAQREVVEISSTFPGHVFLGDNATEHTFKKHANKVAVLHLATHASVDERNPNLSRLYFSTPDSLDDGLLYAYEIFNLQLDADLVTLSACNTAVGAYQEGEGIMSLSRAFAYAGCESMVTSLWPSQDQTTAEIMASFYENLADGAPMDEALRQAKLTFLESADNIKSDPFFWAGFVLIGDTGPLKEGPVSRATLIAVSSLAIGLLAVLGMLRWKKRRPRGFQISDFGFQVWKR